MTLYQITAPHFCAGLLARNGTISEAAPIIAWMVGWQLDGIERYCGRKGWKIAEVRR